MSGPRVQQRVPEKGDPEEPSDHALGRSRGGFGSKLHVLADGNGLALALTSNQEHETRHFASMLDRVAVWGKVGRPHKRPRYAVADKGCSSESNRGAAVTRGIIPNYRQTLESDNGVCL